MKALKTILIAAAAIIVVLFIIVLFMPADDSQDETTTDVEQTDAADFYGTDDESATNDNATGKVIEMDSQMFMSRVANYNGNKDSYIGSMPCVVDFNATWCGPCQQLAPVLEQLAQKYQGRVAFYSVDIDNNSDVSNAYGIESIPTLFFCSNGEIQTYTGVPSEDELESMIANM